MSGRAQVLLADEAAPQPYAEAGVVGGLVEAGASGLLQHPIVGPALEWAGSQLGYGPRHFEALKRGIGVDTTPEKAIQFIAKYGPDIMAGYGTYLAGGRIAVGGLRALAQQWGVREGGQLAAVLARASRDKALAALRGRPINPDQLRELLGTEMRTPLVERLVQLAGGNLSIGAYEGTKALAEGQSPGDAAKTAALWSVVGGTAELGLIGAAKALTGRARFLKPAEIEARGAEQMGLVSSKRAEVEEQMRLVGTQLDAAIGQENALRAIATGRALSRRERGLLGQTVKTKRSLTTERFKLRTQATALEQVEGAEGAFVYTSSRPIPNRGLVGTIRELGLQVAITPEGLMGKFGATGSRVLAAVQQANEQAVALQTISHQTLTTERQRFFELLGYGEGDREPLTSGLLLRLQHEWERIGGGSEAVAQFLLNPPTRERWASRAVGMAAEEGVEVPSRAFDWSKLIKRRLTPEEAGRAGRIFDNVAGHLRNMEDLVHSVGGLGPLDEKQLARLDVRGHITHLSEPGLSNEAFMERLVRFYGEEEASTIAQAMERGGFLPSQREAGLIEKTRRGSVRGFYSRIGRFGTFDHTRTIRGTAWSKSLAGIPIQADPFQAAMLASRHAAFRFEMANVVGPRGELVEFYRDLVRAEALAANRAAGVGLGQQLQARLGRTGAQLAGPEVEADAESTALLFSDILNEVLDNRYYDESLMRVARTLTSVQVASKMAMGVVSNMTQTGNSALMMGTTRALKGLWSTLRGVDPLTGQSMRRGTPLGDELALALALPHTIFKGMTGALDAGLLTQRSERLAEHLLRWTGFSGLEVLNRMSAGVTARLTFRDTVIRASQGRLRGTNLDAAHRLMADLGVSLTEEASQLATMGASRYFSSERVLELTQRVAFAGAQKTQFIPSRFRKPLMWNTPIGRVLFQFKTFALHQSRLLRDQVLAEFAQGNVRPMATALAVAPISGEFIAATKNLLRDNRAAPDNPLERGISNVLYMGGFGLAGEMYQSLVMGDLGGLVGGPTVDTVWDLLRSVATLNPSIAATHIAKLPTVTMAISLADAGEAITDELAERWGQARGDGFLLEDIGAVRARSAQGKQPFGPGSDPLAP